MRLEVFLWVYLEWWRDWFLCKMGVFCFWCYRFLVGMYHEIQKDLTMYVSFLVSFFPPILLLLLTTPPSYLSFIRLLFICSSLFCPSLISYHIPSSPPLSSITSFSSFFTSSYSLTFLHLLSPHPPPSPTTMKHVHCMQRCSHFRGLE